MNKSAQPSNLNRLATIFTMLVIVLHFSLGVFPFPRSDEIEHAYVLFQDDFEDGEAGDWDVRIPPDAAPGSTWAVELDDGNYVLSERGHVWAEAGDLAWTNYTLEVKVKFVTPYGGSHINFRLGIPSSRYFLAIWLENLMLKKEYQGTFSDLKSAKIALKINIWYTLRVICIGNHIKAYIDDVLKLDYVDEGNPISSGMIGLEGVPGMHVLFDDVKVSTTHSLYVAYLIEDAHEEIYNAQILGANTSEAEQKLDGAQTAFEEGDLSSAEALAKETISLAKQAYIGPVSINELSKYSTEYDRHAVEISGTIRDIRYEKGTYRFIVEDSTGVIPSIFNGTLGEIKTDDRIKVLGTFDASSMTVLAKSLEKEKPSMEGLYTLLIFKDDFEDGDFSDWRAGVNPALEGSVWKVLSEGANQVLSGEGDCWSDAGDTEWADYILELKIKLIKGDALIGIRLSPKPPEGVERYGLLLSTHGLNRLIKCEIYLNEERWTDLKNLNIDLDEGAWYNVKVVCVGNNIKMYLDDNLKLDHTDEASPLLAGGVGLCVVRYDGEKLSHIYFDDVKVSKIATTRDIDELIAYAQSEIDKAKEISADVSAAELKLDQAGKALAQEEYTMVQYLIDEAVWLAKRASISQISIKDLKASATKCSGHEVTITGTVRDLEARLGVGYEFSLDDGTGRISIAYQGMPMDIGNEYTFKVTGIFDSPSGKVATSKMEKISGPPSSGKGIAGLPISIEQLATFTSIGGAIVGVGGWIVRRHGTEKKRKILFKRLMDDVDAIYSRFKTNARQCEAELYKIKGQILDEFKHGRIDEDNYNILEKRVEEYMKETGE